MKPTKLTPLALAAYLHFAPVAARVAQSVPDFAASPTAVVLKWIVGALALTGAYHTVSAATGLSSTDTIQGTTGKRLTYQIRLTGRGVGLPESWLVAGQSFNRPGTITDGLPLSLSFSLNTIIISGTPTQEGTFNVDFSAFQFRDGSGPEIDFTLTFIIAPGATPPAISAQPADTTLHAGEPLTLAVAASGGSPLNYQWQIGGTNIAAANSTNFTVNAAAASDAGNYSVVITNAFGTTTSSIAHVVVVPLQMSISLLSDGSAALNLQTIAGRNYVIESADTIDATTWTVAGQITASSSMETFTDSPVQVNQHFWRYHPTS